MLILSFLKKHTLNDKLILPLSFADTIEQTDIPDLLLGYEIDDGPIGFTSQLAYLHQKHPHIIFPDKIVPRLEGLMLYAQHRNAALLCGFSEIGKRLNEKKIPVLLIRDAAIRYYRPNEHRCMWNVDFVLPEENYEEAIQTAIDLGFTISEKKPWQENFTNLKKGAASIDIHCLLANGADVQWKLLKEMFSTANGTTAFEVAVLVPRQENLLLLTLVNTYYNLIINGGNYDVEFLGLLDCANIMKDNSAFDWDIVIDTAFKAGILYQIRTVLEVMDWLLPDILPANLFSKISLLENEADYRVKMDILKNEKCKLYFANYKCRTLRDVFRCLKWRIKYLLLWSIQKNSLLRFLFLDAYLTFHKIVKKNGKKKIEDTANYKKRLKSNEF